MRLLIVPFILLAVGCNAHVFSPPANVGLSESSRTVAVNHTRLGLQFTGQGEIFGPEASMLSARMRQGIAESVEVGADAHFARIHGEPADKNLKPYLGILRVGAKWEVLKDFVALTGGAGGGLSDAGLYIAPDLGIVVAFENPYVIPYGNLSGFVSQPVDAKAIDVSKEDEGVGTNIQTPELTYGFTWAGGVRVPLYLHTGLPVAPYLGFGGTVLRDSEESAQMFGVTGGIDVAF